MEIGALSEEEGEDECQEQEESDEFEETIDGGCVNDETLCHVSHARSLECGGCGDQGASSVARWLLRGGGGNLRVLCLRMTKGGIALTEDGATAMGEALSQNTTIEVLDLANNRIGGRGCDLLCKALETNSTLRSLDLTAPPMPFAHSIHTVTSNGLLRIGLGGAQAVLRLLSHGGCNALECLSLARNALGSGGVAALCRGLQDSSCRLQVLDLSANAAGDYGAEAMAGYVASPGCSLKVLDFTVNVMSVSSQEVLAAAVLCNRCLRRVYLDKEVLKGPAGRAVSNSHALEKVAVDKALSLAMALHPRLGSESRISILDRESLVSILSLCERQLARSASSKSLAHQSGGLHKAMAKVTDQL